jgi:hypothetical protein
MLRGVTDRVFGVNVRGMVVEAKAYAASPKRQESVEAAQAAAKAAAKK